uniref:GPALPP motifs-containing protein 1-like n=1 Tax=Saccoglossus kowalevskii TaxID=10224 RepID=A0ABM0GWL9_SACKO|nr:PREDICTED: GPALPP motifs-containing protein 1-like [Saccoglossus kowalevskii]
MRGWQFDLNMASNIGPALPPGFKKINDSDRDSEGDLETEEKICAGPALPPGFKTSSPPVYGKRHVTTPLFMGPALPPGFKEKTAEQLEEKPQSEKTSNVNLYGPALPPGFAKKNTEEEKDTINTKVMGPALPPGFHVQKDTTEDPKQPSGCHDNIGSSSSEDEDFMIGPMPCTGPVQSSVVSEFEARAQAMKDRLNKKDEDVAPARESWMTELPEYSKAFGLGARTFRKKAAPSNEDRSVWTDTPADTARKAMERETEREKAKQRKPEARVMTERDKKLAEQVARHNEGRRSATLMEIHTKDRKRKAEEDGVQSTERRPFDRERDLNVNQFDDAKKKQMMKRAAGLDNKFSHSKDGVFL